LIDKSKGKSIAFLMEVRSSARTKYTLGEKINRRPRLKLMLSIAHRVMDRYIIGF
jgi:hypothetical protein